MYQINLNSGQFSGPIEKLLSLIEEKKLEITELNLAAITADFIDYLKKIDQTKTPEIRSLAEFVAIAATLILIKSKSILPSLELSGEEEKNIKDLEERLKMYSVFKPAMVLFKNFYERKNISGKKNFSISRQLFLNFQPVFYPAQNVSQESLREKMDKIFIDLKRIVLEEEKIEMPLIKLEEKVAEIIKRIESGVGNFNNIVLNKSKAEIVVLFLALLHLLKEEFIKVEQNNGFDDIIIQSFK